MIRLSSGGVPSPELVEAATVTRLMCDIMAGPTARRRSAVAEMAANGLKLWALSFFFHIVVPVYIQPWQLFITLIFPFQLSCYRILRIDFALNEYASLKKKLIGRLELAQNVRYVIADALAYRNFGAVNFIAENAAAHLDKYSFFSGLEQIVYPMAMTLLSEAARMIFHAKPASMGWKKQSDESDRLGSSLQQHPNGYIGGLIERWLGQAALMEVADSKDVYRQRSLHSSIESIRTVLREDTTFNPICRPNSSRTTRDVAGSKSAGGSAKTAGGQLCLEEDDSRDASHQL
ncbi:hypothetical protein ANCDUO_09301 [Ancylostoma duodenale]|uniref:Uncharacterized protein n=1 Tax=Ancylostoma duodenale TaxID=51022 RepID=A0A0C2GTH8_9BILA|nr:hypothetical protein ANCDUO_09301 [Ancylostoma duodenale]